MAEPADIEEPRTENDDVTPRSHEPPSVNEPSVDVNEASADEVPPEREGPEPKPEGSPAIGEHTAPSCNVGFCPICLAVTAMPLRPEVIEHLLVAGREFFLAAKAVIDSRADQFTGENGDGKRAGRLEKIDIG
jgi:hypothetical protein